MNAMCTRIANCAILSEKRKGYLDPTYDDSAVDGLTAFIAQFAPKRKEGRSRDQYLAQSMNYTMSITHEMCNLKSYLISEALSCTFQTPRDNIKEVMVLR